MKIVFFGTAEFAVASLKAITDSPYELLAVVTGPDKPAGRGKKPRQSPVKEFALQKGIPVMQPEKLKNPGFLDKLKALKADLFVVVAFRMLPEQVWNMPPGGTINLHSSLLPQYRGAAPINHAILNGEKETGVSVFFLRHTIDTGDVILQKSTTIGAKENAGELHDRLMQIGAACLTEALGLIANGRFERKPQEVMLQGAEPKKAPKIFKEDCLLDFSGDAVQLERKIRALSPYPAAFTRLICGESKEYQLKIFSADIEAVDAKQSGGKIITDGNKYLKISTGKGLLNVKELQLQGKKRMSVADFLRGFRDLKDCRILI